MMREVSHVCHSGSKQLTIELLVKTMECPSCFGYPESGP